MAYLRAAAPDEWFRRREAHRMSSDLTRSFGDLPIVTAGRRLKDMYATLLVFCDDDAQIDAWNAFLFDAKQQKMRSWPKVYSSQ